MRILNPCKICLLQNNCSEECQSFEDYIFKYLTTSEIYFLICMLIISIISYGTAISIAIKKFIL